MCRFHVQIHITIDCVSHNLPGHGGYSATDSSSSTASFNFFFPYWQKTGWVITFVQRMNKAQQYLLHHMLGITRSFARSITRKWKARGSKRIDFSNPKYTNQIAINGLDTFIYRFWNTGFFAGRAQSAHAFSRHRSGVFVDGFPDAGVRVSSVETQIDRTRLYSVRLCQLNAPVDERPLRPDTGKQHCCQ